MAKYEVIARGIFVKEEGKIRELQLGEVITEPAEHLMSKLRVMPELEKSFYTSKVFSLCFKFVSLCFHQFCFCNTFT